LETNEILSHCIKTLERYKIPQNFIFIDSIPKNESGKIERNTLREMYAKQ
jgi:fatty-acyl-CoA synthase